MGTTDFLAPYLSPLKPTASTAPQCPASASVPLTCFPELLPPPPPLSSYCGCQVRLQLHFILGHGAHGSSIPSGRSCCHHCCMAPREEAIRGRQMLQLTSGLDLGSGPVRQQQLLYLPSSASQSNPRQGDSPHPSHVEWCGEGTGDNLILDSSKCSIQFDRVYHLFSLSVFHSKWTIKNQLPFLLSPYYLIQLEGTSLLGNYIFIKF